MASCSGPLLAAALLLIFCPVRSAAETLKISSDPAGAKVEGRARPKAPMRPQRRRRPQRRDCRHTRACASIRGVGERTRGSWLSGTSIAGCRHRGHALPQLQNHTSRRRPAPDFCRTDLVCWLRTFRRHAKGGLYEGLSYQGHKKRGHCRPRRHR
jgi:hypothetical protein